MLFTWEPAHLSIGFSFTLGSRWGALSEGNTNFPPICVWLMREKEEVSKERVKDGNESSGGNAIKHRGCKVDNGKATTKKLKIHLPCFWQPSAPSVSSGNTSPVWNRLNCEILRYYHSVHLKLEWSTEDFVERGNRQELESEEKFTWCKLLHNPGDSIERLQP